jgi:hypothetical protein
MNTKRQSLEAAVKQAKEHLKAAEEALEAFDTSPENHRYESVDDAWGILEEALRNRAYQDCQGAYNCGDSYYEQEFYVGDVLYVAEADVEYNRHDKTYYYIEEFKFRIVEAKQ